MKNLKVGNYYRIRYSECLLRLEQMLTYSVRFRRITNEDDYYTTSEDGLVPFSHSPDGIVEVSEAEAMAHVLGGTCGIIAENEYLN